MLWSFNVIFVVWLLLFYATATVFQSYRGGEGPTCDSVKGGGGDIFTFIVRSYWNNMPSAPWDCIPLSHIILTPNQSVSYPILVMPSASLRSDKYPFFFKSVWFDPVQGLNPRPPTREAITLPIKATESGNLCCWHNVKPCIDIIDNNK
jgi:hypothetical protein